MQSHTRPKKKWIATAIFTAIAACQLSVISPEVSAQDFAITLYGGRIVNSNHWTTSVQPGASFLNSYIAVGALSWTAKRFFDDALSLELEGQIAKTFGDQDNWEFNLPIVALRWSRFPWGDCMATSIAWGVGPSYATEVPTVEKTINSTSAQWLVYWFAELAFGPPKDNWALVLRLHHRSTAFGMMADSGGSDTLAAGIKFRF
jgi:hypothetical protein